MAVFPCVQIQLICEQFFESYSENFDKQFRLRPSCGMGDFVAKITVKKQKKELEASKKNAQVFSGRIHSDQVPYYRKLYDIYGSSIKSSSGT